MLELTVSCLTTNARSSCLPTRSEVLRVKLSPLIDATQNAENRVVGKRSFSGSWYFSASCANVD